MIASLGGVWYILQKEWYFSDTRIKIYNDLSETETKGGFFSIPVICIGLTLILSVLSIIYFNVHIDDQGLEIDPEEDVDIMIENQIKQQANEWFAIKALTESDLHS